MMKLDLDKITKKNVNFLLSLPKPYWIRAGNKGVNVKKDCEGCSGCDITHNLQSCYDCWLYVQFDDRNRLKLNRQQEYRGLSHNILWDIKKGKEKPDSWHYIETTQDIDIFLRQFSGYGFWVQKKNKHY